MSKHARDRRPYIKPVTRLELSESNIKLRWIAIAVLLAIAVVSIGYGFYSLVSTEPGWQEITVASDEVNCSADFKFLYDYGAEGGNPTAQAKKLEALYSQLTVSACKLFSPYVAGTDNLYAINAAVNEVITVAPELYDALALISGSGSRHAFMGPAKALYEPVFLSASDAEAALYDPMKDPERQALVRETAAFCADPEMVSLELLGGSQVRLRVSDAYLAFAEENDIEVFLDLDWMTNAFVIDYMADALAAEGFTCGYLVSYDGFTRNLYGREMFFSQNIYHCVDNTVYLPASLAYYGPMSLVSLRSYPLSEQDRWHYYAYEDGSITTVYLDPSDGLSKASIDGITAYSRDAGCAEIVLKLAPVFTAEVFDAGNLELLAHQGIHSVRCIGNSILCTEKTAPFEILDAGYDIIVSNVE